MKSTSNSIKQNSDPLTGCQYKLVDLCIITSARIDQFFVLKIIFELLSIYHLQK